MAQPYSISSSTSALKHPHFELEGSARSVVQFEGIHPKAVPCVAYARVDFDGQIGVVVVVHLTSCLYAEYGGRLWYLFRA